MKAVLTITVHYDDAQNPSKSAAREQLEYAAKHLANNGLLSGDADELSVDEWSSSVETP